MQAAFSPASGLLGDKFDRTHIIAVGALLWGVMTFAIGLSTSWRQVQVTGELREAAWANWPATQCTQGAIWSAFNGVGLALVIPSIQSLVADYNPAEKRGSAFGTLFLVSSMGEGPTAALLYHQSRLSLHGGACKAENHMC